MLDTQSTEPTSMPTAGRDFGLPPFALFSPFLILGLPATRLVVKRQG